MRLVASAKMRAIMGMAMIAMTNRTSKLIIARPKSLSFHAGIEAAGLSFPATPY